MKKLHLLRSKAWITFWIDSKTHQIVECLSSCLWKHTNDSRRRILYKYIQTLYVNIIPERRIIMFFKTRGFFDSCDEPAKKTHARSLFLIHPRRLCETVAFICTTYLLWESLKRNIKQVKRGRSKKKKKGEREESDLATSGRREERRAKRIRLFGYHVEAAALRQSQSVAAVGSLKCVAILARITVFWGPKTHPAGVTDPRKGTE